MVRIELEPLEHKDIIDYLKYALEKKRINEDQNKRFDTTNYDIQRLEFLINILTNIKDRTVLNKKGIGEGNVFYNSWRI